MIPTLLVAHLHFTNTQSKTKNAKELPSQRTKESTSNERNKHNEQNASL